METQYFWTVLKTALQIFVSRFKKKLFNFRTKESRIFFGPVDRKKTHSHTNNIFFLRNNKKHSIFCLTDEEKLRNNQIYLTKNVKFIKKSFIHFFTLQKYFKKQENKNSKDKCLSLYLELWWYYSKQNNVNHSNFSSRKCYADEKKNYYFVFRY